MKTHFKNSIHFATILMFTTNVQSMTDLTKTEINSIQSKVGYTFIDKSILNKAFNKGTSDFETLEHRGDKFIGALIEEVNGRETVAEMQLFIEQHTRNDFFAQRYEQLGFNHYLKSNQAITSDTQADAMEALVGAVAEDYLKRNNNLRGKGRVFRILAPVVQKLIMDSIPTQQASLSAPVQRVITPALNSPAASTKTSVNLIVKNRSGNVVKNAKCKGKNGKDAETNAYLNLWVKLGFPTEKNKTKEKFDAHCRTHGYTASYNS